MYVQANSFGTKDTVVHNKWVLLHDGKNVVRLTGPASCRVVTKYEVFVADSKDAAEAEISRLKLKVKESKNGKGE